MVHSPRQRTAYTKARRRNAWLEVINFKALHPCVDCGEADPIVLDFDHRDRKTKRMGVADMVAQCMSIATIMSEIAKCDVRCANCHRRKTFTEVYSLAI